NPPASAADADRTATRRGGRAMHAGGDTTMRLSCLIAPAALFVVGTLLGCERAPDSGAATSQSAADRLRDAASSLKQEAKNTAHTIKEEAQEVGEQVREATHEVRQQVKD